MTPAPGLDHSADAPVGPGRPRTTEPTEDRRTAAAQRLAERRRRVRKIRKWVTGTGVAVFLAAWALIFANVVSGHDPALSKSTAVTASTQSGTASVSTSTSGAASGSTGSSSTGSIDSGSGSSSTGSTDSGSGSSSTGSTDSGSGSTSSNQSSSSSPSSVTTSQS